MKMYTELEENSNWQDGCRWVLESDSDYEVLDNRHDKGYKYILSIKRMFVQLLRSFVEQGWVSRLDEGNVERIDKSFILQDFKGKEADIVYKVRFGDREVLFYILLELQSSVDQQMPYRLLLYMVEIWRNIIRDTGGKVAARKDFRLPVIVPCVLYNGDDNWTVHRSFRETLAENELFGEYVLDFKYILFDVKRYDEKKLLELANVIGTVFFIDQNHQLNVMLEKISLLVGLMQGMSDADSDVLKTWISNIALAGFRKTDAEEIRKTIIESREVENMVYALETAIRKKLEEVEQQGLEKGKEEGKIEGKINDILEFLGEKGNVSKELREKIFVQDNVDQLGKWLKLAARTNSIDEFVDNMDK